MNNDFKVLVERIDFSFEEGRYLPIATLKYPSDNTEYKYHFDSLAEMEEGRYCKGAVLNCKNDGEGKADIVEIIPPLNGAVASDHFPIGCALCGSKLIRVDDNFECTSSICVLNVAPRLQKVAKKFKITLFGGWTGVALCNKLNIRSATELVKCIDTYLGTGVKLSDIPGIGKASETKLLQLCEKLKSIKEKDKYLKTICIPGMTNEYWDILLGKIPLELLSTVRSAHVEEMLKRDGTEEMIEVVRDNLDAIQAELDVQYIKE